MTARLQKVYFLEFAELKQGDGKGPKFHAGKAYWLTPDQAARWIGEGVAEAASDDVVAENEPGPAPTRPEHVQIKSTRRNRFNVYAHGRIINERPLKPDEAERLRADILAGKTALPEALPIEESEPETRTAELGPTTDDAKPITFQQQIAGGKKTIYALEEWPKESLIAKEALELGQVEGVFVITDDKLEIAVGNGMAIYQLGPLDEQGNFRRATLAESTFYPPPAPPAE